MINLSETEKSALSNIDERELDKLIDEALRAEQITGVSRLPLRQCGEYVSRELRHFDKALQEYRNSKSSQKRERTHSLAIKAGYDLSHAFIVMKERMETEEKEGELFYINDRISSPISLSDNLSVRVSYRWRADVKSEWNHGFIKFHHKYNPTLVVHPSHQRRKPSKAQQKRQREEELLSTWEHLRNLSLYSVRDYFRDGGDGNKIPESFKAIPDGYSSGLNNFSLNFWQKPR